MEHKHPEVQTLVELGLTLLQAKVYLTLVKSGPLKIATISKLSEVARPDVYRTLSKLQHLGLVAQIIETPLHFKAIPMEKGLVSLLESKTEEYSRLKTKTKRLLYDFKGKGQYEMLQTEDRQFVLVPQRKAVITRIRDIIDGAQRSIDLFLSWKRFSFGITSAFAESWERALARGVKFRFIVENPPSGSGGENVVQFCRKNPAAQLRFVSRHPKTVLGIYDKKELCIIVNPMADLPDSPALWSNSQSLITIAQDYFDVLWLTAMENPNYNASNTELADVFPNGVRNYASKSKKPSVKEINKKVCNIQKDC